MSFQARPVVGNWLQCMSEIRRENIKKGKTEESPPSYHADALPSPIARFSNNSLTTIVEKQENTESSLQVLKPSNQSTPAAICRKTRKILRPPQRLVNQVTTWMMETSPDHDDDSCRHEGSESSEHEHVSSSIGWLQEMKRIRRVLTELQIDTAMDSEMIYNALRNGSMCFCCRATKFTMFSRSYGICEICERKSCLSCIRTISMRDLSKETKNSTMWSRDSGMISRDSDDWSCDASHVEAGGVFGQLRKIFKLKSQSYEKFKSEICKDCVEFIQKYH